MQTAFVSTDPKGKMRLEFSSQGEKRIRLWEAHKDNVLETTFDANGSILVQKLLMPEKDVMKRRLHESLKEANASETKEKPFEEVKLNKSCPKCGEYRLSRYVESYASKWEIPVMPLYHCLNCNTKSYYLTEHYLGYLVDTKKELFSEAELSEMERNKSAFINELKGYIIRIFASKKIMSIE